MTSRKCTALTLGLLGSTLGLAAGCGGDTTGDGMMMTEPPRSYDYVINALTIDEGAGGMAPIPASHTSGVAGFNLDGRTTGPMGSMPVDCAHGDFFSTTDPDQNMGNCTAGMARGGSACMGGVDNQIPEIASVVGGFGTDIRMTLRDQIQQGKVAILVRVSDVNGTPGPGFNDSSVRVSVYPISRPMFASCMSIGQPGQTYAVDNESLNTAGNLDSAKITFTGSIVNGRLRVNPPSAGGMPNFTFNLPIMNMNIPLALYQTQLRVSMTPDRGTEGNLGGFVRLSLLTTMLRGLLPPSFPEATVQSVLTSLVDIQDPAGNPMGCSAPNGGISLGLGFTTVRATIAPMTVSGAQRGMCGSM
jgi:hypothetical protein